MIASVLAAPIAGCEALAAATQNAAAQVRTLSDVLEQSRKDYDEQIAAWFDVPLDLCAPVINTSDQSVTYRIIFEPRKSQRSDS